MLFLSGNKRDELCFALLLPYSNFLSLRVKWCTAQKWLLILRRLFLNKMLVEVFMLVIRVLYGIFLFGSKMFKVECQRLVAIPDTVYGWCGLDRVIGERIWLLHFNITLDLAGDSGVCTPENARLGSLLTAFSSAGSVCLLLPGMHSYCDVAAIMHDKTVLFAFRSPSAFVSTHPLFSRLYLFPLVWKTYKYLRFCC